MLQVKSEKKGYSINFPTSLDELSPEVLNQITENITLPKHYTIIAMCYQVKLFDFATNLRSNNDRNVQITPILAKFNADPSTNFQGNVGDKLIVDRSSLERGQHISLPVMISFQNAAAYLKDDEKLLVNIIKGSDNDPMIKDPIIQEMVSRKNETIITLEFKIVPIVDIKAFVPVNSKIVDPFKIVNNLVVN